MTKDLQHIKTYLLTTIKDTGILLLKNKNINSYYKNGNNKNLVTNIDYKIQGIIIDKLLKLTPNAVIISEEYRKKDTRKIEEDTVWIIDPIDGTTNFTHNYPHFCISIALVKNGITVLGVIYNPILDELFYAIKNQGAFLNNQPIYVSKTSKLENSLIGFGFPYDQAKTQSMIKITGNIIHYIQDLRRTGSAALDLAYVACGRLDGFFEFDLEIWDYAAGSLLISEAQGKITDWNGISLSNKKSNIIATNDKIYNTLLKKITIF